MRPTLLLALLLMLLGVPRDLAGQSCNSYQDSLAGIYPSDTLGQFYFGMANQQVLRFVLPADTVVFGYVLQMDSLRVMGLNSAPTWLQWSCLSPMVNCTDSVQSGASWIRFCIEFSSSSQAVVNYNPSFPGYDTLGVSVRCYYDVPFAGVQAITRYLRLEYRSLNLSDTFGVGLVPAAAPLLEAFPSPVTGDLRLRYEMQAAGDAAAKVVDATGREVVQTVWPGLAAGRHERSLPMGHLPAGTYRVWVHDGVGWRGRTVVKAGW